jgi:alkylhydroperoxidase/carboxymuconolactone decarboxylase family protein YurZ
MKAERLKTLFASRNLTKRQKYCAGVSALYALGDRDQALQLIRLALRKDGLPLRFFAELFIHLSLFLGIPAMLDGLERLQRLEGTRLFLKKIKKTAGSRRTGMRIFKRIYGTNTSRVLSKLRNIHPEVAEWIVRDAYGKIFKRRGMTLAEREVVNIVVLGIHSFRPQFMSHVRGGYLVGISTAALNDIFKFIVPNHKIDNRAIQSILDRTKWRG